MCYTMLCWDVRQTAARKRAWMRSERTSSSSAGARACFFVAHAGVQTVASVDGLPTTSRASWSSQPCCKMRMTGCPTRKPMSNGAGIGFVFLLEHYLDRGTEKYYSSIQGKPNRTGEQTNSLVILQGAYNAVRYRSAACRCFAR